MKWLTVLRKTCDETSQAAVARRLGVSPALVNQLLKGSYKGDIERLQKLVEGSLMNQFVMCPVLDKMAKHKCQAHQERTLEYAVANPIYVQLYRACRAGCLHSKLTKEY